MKYSPIKSFRIRNFMSIEDATLTFDNADGILNIKGYNDSGKSAILRALEVVLINKYPSKQAKFIRDDQEKFSILVNFEDGVSILREKYITGKSLYEMYKNNKRVFSTKRGSDFGKVDGVPEPIAQYLGLCVTDDVVLNSRAVQDPKLLVETKGSENFRSLHSVLKVEELVQAIQTINIDRNEMQSQITGLESVIYNENNLLDSMPDFSEDIFRAIRSNQNRLNSLEGRSIAAQGIASLSEEVSDIIPIPEVEGIDGHQLKIISSLSGTIKKFKEDYVSTPPKVEVIDAKSIKGFAALSMMRNLISEVNKLTVPPKVEVISKEEISGFQAASGILANLEGAAKEFTEYREATQRVNKLKEELEKVHIKLHSEGYEFIECQFCGKGQLVNV